MKKSIMVAMVVASLSGNVSAALSNEQTIQAAQMITSFGNCAIIMENERDSITAEYLKNKAVEIVMKVEDNATPRQQKQILALSQEFSANFWAHSKTDLVNLCDELANAN